MDVVHDQESNRRKDRLIASQKSTPLYDFYYYALLPENGDKRPLEFTVTLIDDDPLFLETLKDYLTSMNVAGIETFSSGEEFLKTFKKGDRRFVVCDFDFGSSEIMDGGQVLEAIKKIDAKVPVVILSAQDKLSIAIDALKKGAIDYFIKGMESTFTTVLTSILKTNEIFRLRKDRRDFATLGGVGLVLFITLLVLSYYYR